MTAPKEPDVPSLDALKRKMGVLADKDKTAAPEPDFDIAKSKADAGVVLPPPPPTVADVTAASFSDTYFLPVKDARPAPDIRTGPSPVLVYPDAGTDDSIVAKDSTMAGVVITSSEPPVSSESTWPKYADGGTVIPGGKLPDGFIGMKHWYEPLTPDELSRIWAHNDGLSGRMHAAGSPLTEEFFTLDPLGGSAKIPHFSKKCIFMIDQEAHSLPSNRVPMSSLHDFTTSVAHNLRLTRRAVARHELVMGLPIYSVNRHMPTSFEATKQQRVDNTRWLWAAYNGQLFGENKNIPVFDIEKVDDDFTTFWDTDTAVATDPSSSMSDAVDAEDSTSPEQNMEKVDSSTPIIRSNGAEYWPRKVIIGGRSKAEYFDVQVIRRARETQLPVLLKGSPGTGKTAMCEAALPDLITMQGTADTEAADFTGTFVQLEDKSFKYVDGPLIIAMEEGRPLLVDEVALIDPRVMAILYSVMDGRGELVITADPTRGTIVAQPGFYVIAACNPDVPGAVMSDALLSRFSLQIEVTTDYEMLSHLGVQKNIITVAQNLARQALTNEVTKAPQTRELLAFQKIRKEFGEDLAIANLIASADPTDEEAYIRALSSAMGTSVKALKI